MFVGVDRTFGVLECVVARLTAHGECFLEGMEKAGDTPLAGLECEQPPGRAVEFQVDRWLLGRSEQGLGGVILGRVRVQGCD
mmetsp:Transcript_51124/g.103990  ORF Transcript_51124/g.103990 Transcript_51124/m.103990 type:complete len:82 (+) Transcript_51124:431-676(+)